MEGSFRDEDLLAAFPYATGDDRTVLIEGLGDSAGAECVAVLRRLYASESGAPRTAALTSLARRSGAGSTDICAAVRARSVQLQHSAAMLLAEYSGGDASQAMLDWLDRRLGRNNRSAHRLQALGGTGA